MKRITVGILAHVDSGKTTLSESMLFSAGEIAKTGRVDNGDTTLDTDAIERDRGITIFSKQAVIKYKDTQISLLDTPGHVDFSAETERTLRVLDYAILVISGTDGVQSHTETLWKLLEHYRVPTFVFVNKMDIETADRSRVMNDIKDRLGDACVDVDDTNFFEDASMQTEYLLEEYINKGKLSDENLIRAVMSRRLYLCYFGSALKGVGVEEFMDGIARYTIQRSAGDKLGAIAYKITEGNRGQRLTHIKITSGSLKVKSLIDGEKVNEIRVYSGIKFNQVQEVSAGETCAVTGLNKVVAGQGIGIEKNLHSLVTEPVFSYSLKLPEGADVHNALAVLRKLEQEETELNVVWNDRLQKLDVQVMGEVQMEVLKRILSDRFGMDIEFEEGSIIYKETIASTVEGVGHYEPLRHYAEVHLLLEPGERGSGIKIASKCSEDVLDRNWQRLILTHIEEKVHIGTLIGAPITDIKITLVNGKAHQKHTEGGDFRQATYRALRQGLMQADVVLLEPYASFRLEVPTENTGKAMTDLQQIDASFDAPDVVGEMTVITGNAPIYGIRDYHKSVTQYTHGRGRLSVSFSGYAPCSRQDDVIAEYAYNPEGDTENTPDSVFCSHGSGFVVKWDKVFEHMHLPAIKKETTVSEARVRNSCSMSYSDDELLRIFEQTYGKITRKSHGIIRSSNEKKEYKIKPVVIREEYLLIDGYNIIFANDELKKIAEESLEDARDVLISKVAGYQAMRRNRVILVFDAYKVKGEKREVETVHGISVVYTKEAETADAYIEKTTKQLIKNYRVRVATSDNLEQMIIFGHGAHRVTARELMEEIESTEEEIRDFIKKNNK
ncbi:MAG: TetM/TetW/TetO/TetS family tetracycline resistance ribosomal protection protein [Eubacteriales bacterium]|nr:TetM/TetW/TetO/TetS family tetracycline resistance ribosomal protection protein [Eubacteriales bacterium]